MRHFYSQYSSLILKALFCCTDWQPILLLFHSLTKYLSQLSLQFPNIYRNIIGKEFHMGSFSGLSDSCLSKCTIQLFINNSKRHQHSTFFSTPIRCHYWTSCFFDVRGRFWSFTFFWLPKWVIFIVHYLNTVSKSVMKEVLWCTNVFRS